MKKIFIILLLVISTFSFAKSEKKIEKVYTQKEFDEALKKELALRLDKLTPVNIVDFSKELVKKEESLKLSEIDLKKQNDQLKMNMKSFKSRLKEFQKRQNKFLACIDETDKKKDARISHMVEVIAGMKPKMASDVLSVQETAISVKILGMLEPVKVSKIFNLMDKEISARLQKQYMNMKR
jgi:flagellar motility protein MotE (MotC chaperone)